MVVPGWIGSLVSGMIGDLLNFVAQIANLLYKVLGFPTMASMVFAQSNTGALVGSRGTCAGSVADQLGALLRFGSCQWLSLLYVEHLFVMISWVLIFGLLASLAYRLQSAQDARKVVETSEFAWRLVFVGLMVTLMPLFVTELLSANDFMAQSIGGWVPGAASMLGAHHILGLAQVPNTSPASAAVSGVIALVVAWLRLTVAILMAERTLVLAVMFIVSPVVAWSWAWNPRGSAWGLWVAEVVSLTFLPTSLAITTAAMAALFGGVVRTASMPAWAEVVSMLMLLPTASLLRRLISGWFGMIGMHEDRNAQQLSGNIFGGALKGSLYAASGIATAMFSRGGGDKGASGTSGAAGAAARKPPAGSGGGGPEGDFGGFDPGGFDGSGPEPTLQMAGQAGGAAGPVVGGSGLPAPRNERNADQLRRAMAVGAADGREAGRQHIVSRTLGTAAGAMAGVAGGIVEGTMSVRGMDQRGKLARQWAEQAKSGVQEIGGRIGAHRAASAAYRNEVQQVNAGREPGSPGYTELNQTERDAGMMSAVQTGSAGEVYGSLMRADPAAMQAIETRRQEQQKADRQRRMAELDGMEWA